MKRYYKFIPAMIAVWVSLILAADITFTAYVSDNDIRMDQRVRYTVKVQGDRGGLPDVSFPDFKDFYVLSGPNQSTNMQWINGKMSSSKSYSFILKPRREGRLTIAPASLDNNGTLMKTRPVTVTVRPAGSGDTKKKNAVDPALEGKKIFFKAIPSKTNAYVGEQIIVEYKLYFNINIQTYEVEKLPSNTGFWTEEFDLPRQPEIKSEVINGMNYNVVTLKKVALFPTQSGEITLEPMEIITQSVVRGRARSRSLFDSFFDRPGRTIQTPVKTNTIRFKVKALPARGKPDGFKGAVGNYSLEVAADKSDIPVNEAVSLKIVLKGRGNMKLVELPVPSIPPDIERYEPKIQTRVTKNRRGIGGVKSAEYILIPRVPGTFRLKPLSFSYFDPQKGSYVTLNSRPIVLKISGEARPGQPTPLGGVSRREVTLLGRDIRFIKEQTRLQPLEDSANGVRAVALAYCAVLLLFALFFYYDTRRARLAGNVQLSRRLKAGRQANRWLKDATRHMEGEAGAFYKAIDEALSGYVRDKLNMELSSFNSDEIDKYLTEHHVPPELVKRFSGVLNESRFRQYGGADDNAGNRGKLLEQARDLITQLEKVL